MFERVLPGSLAICMSNISGLGNHSEVVALSGNRAKANQRGEEEHGELSKRQHLHNARGFSGEDFRVSERGRGLVALDDFIAGTLNQQVQKTGANRL